MFNDRRSGAANEEGTRIGCCFLEAENGTQRSHICIEGKSIIRCLLIHLRHRTNLPKFLHFISIPLSAPMRLPACGRGDAASGPKLSNIGHTCHVGNIRAFFRWRRTSSLLCSLMMNYLPVHHCDLGLPGFVPPSGPTNVQLPPKHILCFRPAAILCASVAVALKATVWISDFRR